MIAQLLQNVTDFLLAKISHFNVFRHLLSNDDWLCKRNVSSFQARSHTSFYTVYLCIQFVCVCMCASQHADVQVEASG